MVKRSITSAIVCQCPQEQLEEFLIPDPQHLTGLLASGMPPRFRRLSEQMAGLVDQYSMVCDCGRHVTTTA